MTIPGFADLIAERDGWRLADWNLTGNAWRRLRLYAPGAASSHDTWWLSWDARRRRLVVETANYPIPEAVHAWIIQTAKNAPP